MHPRLLPAAFTVLLASTAFGAHSDLWGRHGELWNSGRRLPDFSYSKSFEAIQPEEITPPNLHAAQLARRSGIRAFQEQDDLGRSVELRIGEQATVLLSDQSQATLQLLELQAVRDPLRNAVREARARVLV